jgi:hypothetical protein
MRPKPFFYKDESDLDLYIAKNRFPTRFVTPHEAKVAVC